MNTATDKIVKPWLLWEECAIVDSEVEYLIDEYYIHGHGHEEGFLTYNPDEIEGYPEFLEAYQLRKQANGGKYLPQEEARDLFSKFVDRSDLEDMLSRDMHADEFFWHDKWDTFSFDMGYLMDEIDKVAPGCNYWRCDAAGYNWRGDSGYTHIAKSEVDEEPLKLLRETLNDFGQCTIRLYWDKESPEFTISSSCHDVPMGATYEYKLVKLEESYEHNT